MLEPSEEVEVTLEPLAGLDRSTLRERAREAVRTAITSGKYRPGDHLGEVELATYLGVSRGTVREAMRHLQQEGLLTTGRRGMLRVNSLSTEEVRELFRVRAALEGLAASQIISSADRGAAADSLRAALARLVEPDTDFIARVDADLGFHLVLCQLSKNSVLVDTWRHLEGRLRVVIVAAGPVRAQPLMSRERHNAIIDTIESGSMSAAVDAINQHMALAADQLAVRAR